MIELAPYPAGGYVATSDPGEPTTGHPRVSITDREGDVLARMFAGMNVLEIGTGLGKSTRAMAATAKDIVTVDPDPWVREHVWPGLAALEVVGLHVSVERLGRNFDACFIDADHSTSAVTRDIRDALRLVKPGGLIVLHDFNSPGVQEGARAAGIECEAIASTYGLGVYRIPQEVTQ
jgi:predicted O-methyltransferase YrrM